MTYQDLIQKFFVITHNRDKAIYCSLLMVELNIEELESETFISSLSKLKLHEWKKLRSQLKSLLEEQN